MMTNAISATADDLAPHAGSRPKLDGTLGPRTVLVFLGLLALGLFYTA